MDELDEYKENITANLSNLEDLINRSPLFDNDPAKWRTQINGQFREIRK